MTKALIKEKQLGISSGKARSKLSKSILFDLVKKCKLDRCYRCGKKINNTRELSIDHKIPWLHSKNTNKLVLDLNNISFSHLSCNVSVARKNNHRGPGLKGEDNPGAKLTKVQVCLVREKYRTGNYTSRKLGKLFSISKTQILKIVKKEHWN